ncbi:hypothetical protein [Salinibaculum rarum]|uniref:hypothetical protein n=1 Tax=Salinibaculum rarum TaxID=3058903 RepID=UPI0026604357|nr:hypothetical protein [Salinibaculum sp. KK48]
MPPSVPFIDRETGALDTDQILSEAYPLTGLIALFAGLALIPFLLAVLFAMNSLLGTLFVIVAQFVLAVGTGIVLMYVIARGIQLADA